MKDREQYNPGILDKIQNILLHHRIKNFLKEEECGHQIPKVRPFRDAILVLTGMSIFFSIASGMKPESQTYPAKSLSLTSAMQEGLAQLQRQSTPPHP